jgi:hypothetical protein
MPLAGFRNDCLVNVNDTPNARSCGREDIISKVKAEQMRNTCDRPLGTLKAEKTASHNGCCRINVQFDLRCTL